MTVSIRLRGDFDATTLDASFPEAISALELAGAQGRQFVTLEDEEGRNTAVRIANITTVRDED